MKGEINMNYTITYEDIKDILKEYGRKKGKVWLTYGYGRTAYVVQLKYDTSRRYFVTPIYAHYESYHKNIPMVRVPMDVFKSEVEYLLQNGYTISF
jgi:hypothetical protein